MCADLSRTCMLCNLISTLTAICFIAKVKAKGHDDHVWIGARAYARNSAFYWLSDGYPVDPRLYHDDGQPNEIVSVATCLSFWTKGRNGYDDYLCETNMQPFCKLCPGSTYFDVLMHIAINILVQYMYFIMCILLCVRRYSTFLYVYILL